MTNEIVVALAAFAVAFVAHWAVNLLRPPSGSALRPDFWYIETAAMGLGLRFWWLGQVLPKESWRQLGAGLATIAFLLIVLQG